MTHPSTIHSFVSFQIAAAQWLERGVRPRCATPATKRSPAAERGTAGRSFAYSIWSVFCGLIREFRRACGAANAAVRLESHGAERSAIIVE